MSFSELIDAYNNIILNKLVNSDDKELQDILDRPFKPHPFNKEFDFEKFCSGVILKMRGIEYGLEDTAI